MGGGVEDGKANRKKRDMIRRKFNLLSNKKKVVWRERN